MIETPALRGSSAPELSRSVHAGSGHLGVEQVAGQSAVTSVWSRSPLQILTPRARGQSVWAFLASLGGGLVAGDDVRLSVSVGAQARCFLGTQASTKVYRNPDARVCRQSLNARVGQGALLVVAPDPVQAFAGSLYSQRQEFYLESGSSLVLVDWLCSGRAARGERWAFNRYQSRNEVFQDGQRLLVDSLVLTPEDGPLDGPLRLGRFNCVALVVIVGRLLEEPSARLLERVQKERVVRRAPLVLSASPVGGGVLLRVAGESVEAVGGEIRRCLEFLAPLLADDPWGRKW